MNHPLYGRPFPTLHNITLGSPMTITVYVSINKSNQMYVCYFAILVEKATSIIHREGNSHNYLVKH